VTATVLVIGGGGQLGAPVVSHMLAAPDSRSASLLRAKWSAEHAIAASGVPYTIFRPTYFMETLPRHIRGRTATCSAVSGTVSTCSLRRISPPWCPAR
jgi:hypothetical protein